MQLTVWCPAQGGGGGAGDARRGSVVLLVVAVLGLLAVIGTVYVVSTRAERASAEAMSRAVNLDWAQQAVNEQVRQAISNSLYDAKGVPGGYSHEGPLPPQAGLRHMMPERGVVHGTGYSNQNKLARDNMWLVQNLYRDGSDLDDRYNDLTLLSAYAYNPAKGEYDTEHPFYDERTGDPAWPMFKVVSEDAWLEDGFMQLLPASEATGIRYRFGVRVIDTSRMANLNTGVAANSTLDLDAQGTSPFTIALGHPAALDPRDQAGSLDQVRRAAPMGLADELGLRAYGSLGTSLALRMTPAGPIWPNTLGVTDGPGSEKVVGNARRALYTAYSSTRYLRPYLLPDDAGSRHTYSFTIEIGQGLQIHQYDDPGKFIAYTLTPPGETSLRTWPAFPTTVAANPNGKMEAIFTAATNIATAMEKIAGYSHEEAVAFAANYVSARWHDWWYNLHTVDAEWLVNGPMFVDEEGICNPESALVDYVVERVVRKPPPHAWGGRGTMDLKAEPGRTYIGYAAQPFINEVAVRRKVADRASPEDDFAVELYNPYSKALSLRGLWLYVGPGRMIDLSGGGPGHECFVPARGYFVVTRKGRDLALKVAPGTMQVVGPGLDLSQSTKIRLMREYVNRGSAANQISFAAVDEYDITGLIEPGVAGNRADGDHYMRRGNDDPPGARGDAQYRPRWCAAVYDPVVAEVAHDEPKKLAGTTEHMTLGSANPRPPASRTFAVALYDRWLDRRAEPGAMLYNVNEFSRIPRIAHEIDTATGLPAGAGTLSEQLWRLQEHPAAAVARTEFPGEAGVYFDFRTPPYMYGSDKTAGPDEAMIPANPPYPPGDVRAMRLLECLNFFDMDPRGHIEIPAQAMIPGQINVNTAPAEVLSMVPMLNHRPDWVGAILAYRWRTRSDDPRIPPYYRTAAYDFTDSTREHAKYPGYGIRSLGELEVPLSVPFPNAASLQQREALWSDVFNLCTVRSDTFVLYGYLEAVRQNPRYQGPFDNFENWYETDSSYVTDDPGNSTAPLLRVGRRRWVALLDTSSDACRIMLNDGTMNPNFVLPRIVASRNMPH